jgi:hypothetical protein
VVHSALARAAVGRREVEQLPLQLGQVGTAVISSCPWLKILSCDTLRRRGAPSQDGPSSSMGDTYMAMG